MAVEVLANGHILMAGATQPSGNNNHTICLIRTNASGDVLWTKTIVTGTNAVPADMVKTQDGNLLLVYNNIGANPGLTTTGWAKITPDGDILWAKKSINNAVLTKITPVASGGYLLCGENITGGTARTGMVLRLDESGASLWSTVFGENGSSTVRDCWEDPLGFVYCCGSTSELGGDQNGFWAKLAADGTLLGPVVRIGSNQDDAMVRIAPIGNDRLLLCGWTSGFTNDPYSALWTAVLDYSGDLKTAFIYTLDETDLTINDLIEIPNNQYVLALGTRSAVISPAILLKINDAGDQLFSAQYKGNGESDAFFQVKRSGSGLLSVGVTAFNGDNNAYLVATDLEGNFDDEDCCPVFLNIDRFEADPEVFSFVPTQTAFYASQPVLLSVGTATADTKDLCNPFELDFSLSRDTICKGECVEITNEVTTPGVLYSYEIQGGEANPNMPQTVCHSAGPVLFITRVGVSGGCEKKLTKVLNLGAKKDDFPNAFTPNGDGANDVFKPVYGCPAVRVDFRIYNRWGKLVFQSTDPMQGWDGKSEGAAAPSDVYVWVLEYEVEQNGQIIKIPEQGQVTLLR